MNNLHVNTGRLFYLRFKRNEKLSITCYHYSPGGYPQYDATFEEWKKHCIKFAKKNGFKYVDDATQEEYINQ